MARRFPTAALTVLAGLAAGPLQAAMVGHGGPVKDVAVAADGERALTAGFDYSLILWDIDQEATLARLHGHEAAVNAVVFLPDQRHALSASDDGTLMLWNLKRGEPDRRFEGHRGKVVDVAVSADGRHAASAGWDRTVRLWDLADGRPPRALDAEANLNTVAFTDGGREVLAGDADGTLYAWRAADGSQVLAVKRHDFAITALAADETGETVATASVDETVQLWDLAAGEVTATLYGHQGPVLAVALSADGRLVASGGIDGTVRVWRRGDGDRLKVYDRHAGPVWSVAFAPDGEALLSAGADGLVVTYDLDAPAGQDEAEVAAAQPVLHEAPDDGSRGAKLFKTCAACHTVSPDGGNRAGPTLHGLFGREAGSLPGYPYSDALERSDLVWTEATVSRLFEIGPEHLTPGSKMPLQRMPDAADRTALIDYLKRVTGPGAGHIEKVDR